MPRPGPPTWATEDGHRCFPFPRREQRVERLRKAACGSPAHPDLSWLRGLRRRAQQLKGPWGQALGSLCRKADCAGCALGPLICLMCVDRPEARGSDPEPQAGPCDAGGGGGRPLPSRPRGPPPLRCCSPVCLILFFPDAEALWLSSFLSPHIFGKENQLFNLNKHYHSRSPKAQVKHVTPLHSSLRGRTAERRSRVRGELRV